jgi:hypothetical protein
VEVLSGTSFDRFLEKRLFKHQVLLSDTCATADGERVRELSQENRSTGASQ